MKMSGDRGEQDQSLEQEEGKPKAKIGKELGKTLPISFSKPSEQLGEARNLHSHRPHSIKRETEAPHGQAPCRRCYNKVLLRTQAI